MGNCCKRDTTEPEPAPISNDSSDKKADDSKVSRSKASSVLKYKPSVVVPESNRMDNVMDIFEKVKSLGHGATSEVYEVRFKDDPDKGTFALKIMLRTAYDNAELFAHECNIMTQLDHPNIIRFIDAYEDENNLYILTEVCRGGELFDRIVASHHFTETKAASIIKTMLELLKTMHDSDVVHRDLKPENFVYQSKADDSAIKLVDFGVARKVVSYEVYGDIVGTAFYLAPESANPRVRRTGEILKYSDIWSIGVITYVILTGCPPFYGRSNHAIFNSILRGKVSFKRHQHVSEVARDFILSLLKQNPHERLNADKALEHDWIKGKAQDVALSLTVVDSLKNFSKHCGLVRAFARLMVDKMNSADRNKLEGEFNKLDLSKDGVLHAHELSTAMRHAGYNDETAEREAAAIVEGVDVNDDEKVDLLEYETALQPVLSRNMSDLKRTFRMLSEGGEFIKKDNINRVFGWKNRVDDLHDMFDEIDFDHDGKISFTDFVIVMKGGKWRSEPEKILVQGVPADGQQPENHVVQNITEGDEMKGTPPQQNTPVDQDNGDEKQASPDGIDDNEVPHDHGGELPSPKKSVGFSDDEMGERKSRKDSSEDQTTIALPLLTDEDKVQITSTFRYHQSMGVKPSTRYPSMIN